MDELLLSPGRISWPAAVLATIVLLLAAEAARYVAWSRGHDPRVLDWSLPGHRSRAGEAIRAGFERVKLWLRVASVAPFALAPVPMLRPPADIATVVVGATIAWWALFAALALADGQRVLRHAR